MKFINIIFLLFFVSCNLIQAQASGVDFRIKSSDIKGGKLVDDKFIFNGFGCNGQNISPQISWVNVPPRTKSFALTVFDPDAPTQSGWWHWLVLNIPVSYKELPQGFSAENNFNLKDGIIQIRNDFSSYSYGGPCPPAGDKKHRYIFTLYALAVDKIDLKENTSPALASFMINQYVLRKAIIEAIYKR
jgi:Raf kinase inhibitor-like YbhB/YbcL family protein